jgi:hypothetical protein
LIILLLVVEGAVGIHMAQVVAQADLEQEQEFLL